MITNGALSTDLDVTLDFGRVITAAQASRLTAPGLDATSGTAFAGVSVSVSVSVSVDGSFAPPSPEPLTPVGSTVTISVPAASAVLVEVGVVAIAPIATTAAAGLARPVETRPEFTG